MAKQNLLLCLKDADFQSKLLEKAGASGFKVSALSEIPSSENLGTLLPDAFLIDMDWIVEVGLLYLESIYEEFPSVWIVILSDAKYVEEDLFLTLKSGARGWIFKQDPEKVLDETRGILERGYFLKPFVSQFILEEFKNFTSGEPLLTVEEEILRSSARGQSPQQIQKSLSLSKKFLRSHWENIWQKLNINSRAKAEVESMPIAEKPHESKEGELMRDSESLSMAPNKLAASQGGSPPEAAQEAQKQTREESPVYKNKDKSQEERIVESLQLVTFRLGKEEFALNITQLQEIQRMLPITPIPKVPDFVEGIVNLRGKIVPVIDLRKRLGYETSEITKEVRIVVVNMDDKIIGMIVDAVQEVLRINSDAIEPPPSLVLRMDVDYIQGVINQNDRLILLLDANRIIRYEEKEKLVHVGG